MIEWHPRDINWRCPVGTMFHFENQFENILISIGWIH